MRSSALCIAVTVLFLPPVLAQISSGDDFGSGSHFDAPPLENANLALYGLLFLATLVQVGLAISFLFRARSPHLLPGAATVVAFLFLAISYGLGVAITVIQFTFDDFGDQSISKQANLNIDIATTLFFDWVDPMMFLAVALVLRDRFLTHTKQAAPTDARVVPLLPFTFVSCTLCILLFVTSTASVGIFGAAFTSFYNFDLSVEGLDSQLNTANHFYYAFVAIVVITSLYLAAFAIVVKKYAKGDKITNVTLFGIIPLLCLRALSRLIFVILNARLPLSKSYTLTIAYALDFSSTIVYGVLFFAVGCILVFCFMGPRLWYNVGEHVAPQYGGYPAQQQPHYQGGMQPVAQFPGQWGFTGQPQQPMPNGYPFPPLLYQGANGGYPPPQNAAYHPNQQLHLEQPISTATTSGEARAPGGKEGEETPDAIDPSEH